MAIPIETDLTMYYGGVGVARTGADGALDAVADPRRNGFWRIVHC